MGSSTDGQERRCAHCGELLGVYEPLVILIDGLNHGTTSLAVLGEPPDNRLALLHQACHQGAAFDTPSQPDAA